MDAKEAFKTLERDRAVRVYEPVERLMVGFDGRTGTEDVYVPTDAQLWVKGNTIYLRPSTKRGLQPVLHETITIVSAIDIWLKAQKIKLLPVHWFDSEEDFLTHFLGASDDSREVKHAKLGKLLFDSTDCGAWIEFRDDCVRVGSIVEGCDFGTSIYPLKYPFSDVSYYARIAAVEHDADETFKWANDTDDDDQTAADRGEDAPDVSFDYEHLGQDGCSS
jgi:hypothetical protein